MSGRAAYNICLFEHAVLDKKSSIKVACFNFVNVATAPTWPLVNVPVVWRKGLCSGECCSYCFIILEQKSAPFC